VTADRLQHGVPLSLERGDYATLRGPAPASIESGTGRQGIVPNWNNSPAQVPLAAVPAACCISAAKLVPHP
jgi:hypothetical protein